MFWLSFLLRYLLWTSSRRGRLDGGVETGGALALRRNGAAMLARILAQVRLGTNSNSQTAIIAGTTSHTLRQAKSTTAKKNAIITIGIPDICASKGRISSIGTRHRCSGALVLFNPIVLRRQCF